MEPTSNDMAVPKSYCDSNSGKTTNPTGGGIFNFLGGLLGGAISGALTSLATQGITQTFGNLAGQGLTALGSLAGNLFGAGMRVGSAADWTAAKAQPGNINQGALIDNLKDDIANGGSASGDAVQGG
jgi:hypothetical protein